jgi:enamine deaminase RidA (YjgF/YER057c/UK114 family)
MMQILNPPHWPRPKGYSNGIAANGRLVFVAGQIGWTPEGIFESDVFWEQARQSFSNTIAVLSEAGANPEHIVRMTWFVTSRQEYLEQQKEIGKAYREIIGKHYPVMSVVAVSELIEARAKVEIETTAVIPENFLPTANGEMYPQKDHE